MHPLIEAHRAAIIALCREFGVEKLEIFGSVTAGTFDSTQSDIDFLVTYPSGYDFGPWGSRFIRLEEQLALLLGRDVDLITSTVLERKNIYFQREVNASRRIVFDASKISEVA